MSGNRGHRSSRFACLWIPDLPLAAVLRTEPELRGTPLGVIETPSDRLPEKRSQRTWSPTLIAGWMRGHTVAQARAVEPDLVVRPLSLEAMRSAEEALLDVAASVTPRVMRAKPGVVFLDLEGTGALFPTERGLLTALEARLAGVGLLTIRLGLGSTRTVAELAARYRTGDFIVRAGDEHTFLDPLPLDLLDPPEDTVDRLWRWGIRNLGELADLPRDALGARVGEAGVQLARRACGEDLDPFRATPPSLRFEEAAECEFGVTNLERLSFLLRGALDRLVRRLRLRGLAVHRLRFEALLEGGRAFAREVALAAPTVEVATLLSLVRLRLEKDPPRETIERIRVIAEPGSVELDQLDFFLPPLPAPAELAMTVARIESLCGPGEVGAPGARDTHQPDASVLEPFELENGSARALTVRDAPTLGRASMGLRAIRPPRALDVRGDNRPRHVDATTTDPPHGRVVHCAGPWRLIGEWWGESRFARDYWDVEIDSGVWRIYQNLEDQSWYADGVYD